MVAFVTISLTVISAFHGFVVLEFIWLLFFLIYLLLIEMLSLSLQRFTTNAHGLFSSISCFNLLTPMKLRIILIAFIKRSWLFVFIYSPVLHRLAYSYINVFKTLPCHSSSTLIVIWGILWWNTGLSLFLAVLTKL